MLSKTNWYYVILALFFLFAAWGHAQFGTEHILTKEDMLTMGNDDYANHFYSWHIHTATNLLFAGLFAIFAFSVKPERTYYALILIALISIVRPLFLTSSVFAFAPQYVTSTLGPILINIFVILFIWLGYRKANLITDATTYQNNEE